MGNETVANVFIIESLRFEDEDRGGFEGQILQDILRLIEKQSTYYYIRTKRELQKLAPKFGRSKHRYLHLSCHADAEGMATTLDDVSFEELGRIFRPHLSGRRVFLSACEMATPILADALLGRESGCFSVIGPSAEVAFSDAALLWSSFYHLMFRTNESRMKRPWIKQHLQSAADLFKVPMNYFYKMSPAAPVKLLQITPTVSVADGAARRAT